MSFLPLTSTSPSPLTSQPFTHSLIGDPCWAQISGWVVCFGQSTITHTSLPDGLAQGFDSPKRNKTSLSFIRRGAVVLIARRQRMRDGPWQRRHPHPCLLSAKRGTPTFCGPPRHSGLIAQMRAPKLPLTPASNICVSFLQLAGPAVMVSGESYESLGRDLRQERS